MGEVRGQMKETTGHRVVRWLEDGKDLDRRRRGKRRGSRERKGTSKSEEMDKEAGFEWAEFGTRE